jgi:iron complex outermembrane receptor protein
MTTKSVLPGRIARTGISRAAALLAAAFCLAASGRAQTAPAPSKAAAAPDGDVVSLQSFVVTGSNIQRLEMEKIVPVTVMNMDAINTRLAFTPVDLLTSLPQVTNLPENETRLGSSGARGDNANINLRNLGSTGTLILQDGRRMAINPMTAGLSQAVNINQLPTQGIDHVEVLRDGASAIYGSDAVGGVVNYVMRRDFVGTELILRYGDPEGPGGTSTQASVSHGRHFAGDKGRLVATFEYLFREASWLTAKEFSKTANNTSRAPAPFNNLGGAFDGRINRGYYPTFRLGTGTSNNFFRYVNGTLGFSTVTPPRDTNPEFYLDINPFGMSAPRTHRANSFVSLEYDLTPTVTVFGDLSYYKSKSTMARQPVAINAPNTDAVATMAINNPFNPYGSSFYDVNGAPTADGKPRITGAPRTIGITAMTIADLGKEYIDTQADVIRFAAGLKGKIADNWKWEAAGFYNRVKGKDNGYPNVRESKFQAAVARTDASAYNPFGYTFKVVNGAVVPDAKYTNPQSVVDSFSDVFSRNAQSLLASGDIRVSGKLFALWAGDVSVAAGAEYRSEDLKDLRPPFSGDNSGAPNSGLDPLNNDFLLHPARPDVRGDRTVGSFYVETVIPLAAPKNAIPLINTLELSGSARHERYSDFGNTTKPKIGVNWRPVPQVMLRASYNEGFMAPSLAAIYTSARWTTTAGSGNIDLYRNPVTNEGAYPIRNYFGGNLKLKPAESKGRTAGVVIDVPGLKGLSITADYWRITRTDLLGQRSSNQVAVSDTALLQAFVASELAAGKKIDQIDIGSGTANYKGDPDITRYAVTPADVAAFAAYNAANPTKQQAVAGRIFADNTPFLNLATSYDEGWDFGLTYVFPKSELGNISVNSDWAYLMTTKNTLKVPNLPAIETDSLDVNGAARWRGTTTVSWRNGAWSGSLGAYYAGETSDAGATTTAATYESLGRPVYIAKQFSGGVYNYRYMMGDTLTYNLSAGYQFGNSASSFLRKTKLRLGVANLFNKQPPLASGAFGYSPGVTGNLFLGRVWSLEITKNF